MLDLDYHKKSDQQTFKRIMKIIDPDETKIVTKEDLLEFFSIPGFLNLARVEQFNPKTQNTKNEEQNKFSSGY